MTLKKKKSLAILFVIICQCSYANKFESNTNKFINIFNQFCIDSSNFSDQAVNLEKNNFIILPTKYQQKFPLIHKDQGLVYAKKYDKNYYIVGIDPKNTCEVLSNNESLQNIKNAISHNYAATPLKILNQNSFISEIYTAQTKDGKPLLLQIRYLKNQPQNHLMLRVKKNYLTQKGRKFISSIQNHMSTNEKKYIKISQPKVIQKGQKFVSKNSTYQFSINQNWKKVNPLDPTASFSLACDGPDCATKKPGQRTIMDMAFNYKPTVFGLTISDIIKHFGAEQLENQLTAGIIRQPSISNFKKSKGKIVKIGDYNYFAFETSYKIKTINSTINHYILASLSKGYFTQIVIDCDPSNCQNDYPLALNVIKTLKYR